MAKRVGITTNIKERKAHWKREHSNLRNFKEKKKNLTQKQAQETENKYIKKGYKGHPGGKKKPGKVYSVYTFNH